MEERKPRILFYDIETSPIIGYTWGVWQQDVVAIKENWQILTVAWKWLGEKKVHVVGQDDFAGYKPGVNNDTKVVETIHALFNEADIVIAHNGNSFDQKKAQARILIRGMKPPTPYKQLDTKLLYKRYFAFTRNNLKWLAKDLGVTQKGDPGGFGTWEGCLSGDPKAWKQMKKYNKQDIPPLEDLYLRVLPWVTNHPNMARLSNLPQACPKCGVPDRMQCRGTRVTNASTFLRYQCQACGGWGSSSKALPKDQDIKPSFNNYTA